MKNSLSIVVAGAMALSSVGMSFSAAEAAMPRIAPAAVESGPAPAGIVQVEMPTTYRMFRRHGRHHGGWDGYNGWDRPRDSHYGWRHHRHGHRHHGNFGAGLAVGGILGLATGAILSQPRGYGYSGGYGYDGYDAACSRRYRSYDPYSNTYMGYDGYRHRCVLR